MFLSFCIVFLMGFKNFVHRSGVYHGSSGVIVTPSHVFDRVRFNEDLHVKENKVFIDGALRFGRYLFIDKAGATTSMRRFERQSVFFLGYFWFSAWLKSWFADLKNEEYEAVR